MICQFQNPVSDLCRILLVSGNDKNSVVSCDGTEYFRPAEVVQCFRGNIRRPAQRFDNDDIAGSVNAYE